MAGVIFAASAQRGLSRDFLMRLMSEVLNYENLYSHLSFYVIQPYNEFFFGQMVKCPQLGGTTETGALDEIPLALHMALLYALDLSVLHRYDIFIFLIFFYLLILGSLPATKAILCG